jgi:hypothetical protein
MQNNQNECLKFSDGLTLVFIALKFLDKFPDYWEPNSSWTRALKDLVDYVEIMKIEVDKLEIHKIVDKNVTYEFYNSNNVRKLLKFNY